jgi:hypothetical protein
MERGMRINNRVFTDEGREGGKGSLFWSFEIKGFKLTSLFHHNLKLKKSKINPQSNLLPSLIPIAY